MVGLVLFVKPRLEWRKIISAITICLSALHEKVGGLPAIAHLY